MNQIWSTHNFLDIMVAKGVGCPTQLITAHRVLVANGDELSCNFVCKVFQWKMQGTSFHANVLIMPISGCKFILGMEWLNSLGVVRRDFPKLRMEFY